MTCIVDTKAKRHLPAMLAAALAISAFLALGTFVASASAEDQHRNDHHGGDHRGDRGRDHGNWNGGYYSAPPVVYGGPYYAPPPVVYGPAIGISLPGVSIGIL